MKTIAISVFFVSFMVAGTDPSAVDSAGLLNEAGMKDGKEGRYTAAALEFAAEVKIWRSLGDDYQAHLAVALANLGFAKASTGAFSESLECYQEALSLSLAVFGSHSLHTAQIMNDYARSLMSVDADDKAATLLEKALTTTHSLTPGGTEEARSLRGLALVAARKGDARKSEELLQRVSLIPGGRTGEGDVEAATVEASLARLYTLSGDFRRGESLLTHAAAVFARYMPGLDPRSILLSAQQGMQYVDEGKYALARRSLEDALQKLKSIGAENTPGAAIVENSLALAQLKLGETRTADELLDHALSVEQAAFQAPNRAMAATLINRALSFEAQGRYPEAIEAARKSIDTYGATIGSGHPETANALMIFSNILKEGGSGKNEAKLARNRAQAIFRQFASSDTRKK